MRLDADPAVRAWLDRQAAETLYLTAINFSELLLGVELLPAGKRRRNLAEGLGELLDELFGPRILPFDQEAAAIYARIIGRAQARGFAIGVADGQIAAIAATHGFVVATRDAAPFKAAGVPVIDPWQP